MIKIKNVMQEINKHECISSNECFYLMAKTNGEMYVYRRAYVCDDHYIYCVYCENGGSYYTEFTRTESFNNRFDEDEYGFYKCRISKIHTDVEIEV